MSTARLLCAVQKNIATESACKQCWLGKFQMFFSQCIFPKGSIWWHLHIVPVNKFSTTATAAGEKSEIQRPELTRAILTKLWATCDNALLAVSVLYTSTNLDFCFGIICNLPCNSSMWHHNSTLEPGAELLGKLYWHRCLLLTVKLS